MHCAWCSLWIPSLLEYELPKDWFLWISLLFYYIPTRSFSALLWLLRTSISLYYSPWFSFYSGSCSYRFCFITFPRLLLCPYRCLIWIVPEKRIERNESLAWRWTVKESVTRHVVTQYPVNSFLWRYFTRTISWVMYNAVIYFMFKQSLLNLMYR
jgi:hypothetical protein